MLIKNPGRSENRSYTCLVCGEKISNAGRDVGVCPDCLRSRWDQSRGWIESLHAGSREPFRLPVQPPQNPRGIPCKLCFHACRMGPADVGYCGVRNGSAASLRHDGRTRARVSHYYDPLPTNCVADWVCAGGTGAGYPEFTHDRGTEVGFYNLAVFYEACNFNCLYCQNWHFKSERKHDAGWRSVGSMVEVVNEQTSCICFFGGDPTPQLPHALQFSSRVRARFPGRILRICWETNCSMHHAWLKRMARLSLESGGCIKVDLKAWNPNIHRALCGCDNRQVLENFRLLSRWVDQRPVPPFLIASTLLVPGYVGEEEVYNLASFIADLNADIPYALLAFAPQFCLEDFPTTSLAQAEACLDAAERAGLRRVRLGNRHLLR